VMLDNLKIKISKEFKLQVNGYWINSGEIAKSCNTKWMPNVLFDNGIKFPDGLGVTFD
jgi:hypothetical protein